MGDLISREELKKTVKRMESLPWCDEKGNRVEFVWTSEEVQHLIDKAPAVQRNGRWIGNYCSECGEPKMDWFINKTKRWAAFNYCPNCGAKMEAIE